MKAKQTLCVITELVDMESMLPWLQTTDVPNDGHSAISLAVNNLAVDTQKKIGE
jgi:hypothetical protein